ncbi:anhydro-N-acetylmuramic acid kinase [Brevibacterium spongiae]|uniref:Anhydro-N-acetylmuramic acid kinase n=1 Tax=Brevibacterium spongiae TaxID=2909672 RepID=A0ABY5SR95_9MICO|nr:anhydro-N-acetylmuramic acid kinase [Brevibacterium spongiae]UVI35571.1 anhydro-N-acetylmuramic acid kinase [Brevibacterium spongiae]
MIIAGLMTGTSADGLDLVIAEFLPDPTVGSDLVGADPTTLTVRILAERETPFDEELSADILRLLEPADVPLSLVSSVDARLGRFSAEALSELCSDHDLRPDLVVSHGQTVRHDISDGQVTSTLQLGQPAFIAERLGVPVLSDVRSRDVAAGGQGAPLVGLLDSLLLSDAAQADATQADAAEADATEADATAPTAVLNLGGIANITVIAPDQDPVAFDTGPANALIDILARRITDGSQGYDRDGALAAAGTVDEELLTELLTEPYYELPAPKSTGKELFHAAYLDSYLRSHPHLGEHDQIATVTALTARTIAEAARRHDVTTVIASGGGTRNPELMRRLGEELGENVELTSTDEAFGLPEGSKEALLMALLGWLSWHGLDGTEPSLTGARGPRIAGRFTPGDGPLQLPEPLHRRPARLRLAD